MADAVRETFGVEVELENIGGVRAPLVRGPITLADLVTLDPFDNTIVTYTIPGSHLRAPPRIRAGRLRDPLPGREGTWSRPR